MLNGTLKWNSNVSRIFSTPWSCKCRWKTSNIAYERLRLGWGSRSLHFCILGWNFAWKLFVCSDSACGAMLCVLKTWLCEDWNLTLSCLISLKPTFVVKSWKIFTGFHGHVHETILLWWCIKYLEHWDRWIPLSIFTNFFTKRKLRNQKQSKKSILLGQVIIELIFKPVVV